MMTCAKCMSARHAYGECPDLTTKERWLYRLGVAAILGLGLGLVFASYLASTFRWGPGR